MKKDVFSIALVIAGILSLLVGFWGIHITAMMLGYISELRIVLWNVILFATLIAAGSLAIGYAVGKTFGHG